MRLLENILLYLVSYLFIGFMGWLLYKSAGWIPVAILVVIYFSVVIWARFQN